MAAVTTAVYAVLSHNSHVVVTDDSYRRTRQFLTQTLHRYGIEVSTVPAGDYDAIEEAIRPTTRLLVSESPTNPYNRIVDMERFAEIGRRHRVKTLIDATFATTLQPAPARIRHRHSSAFGDEISGRSQ
jgi:cystathionine gamma-synthase